MAKETERRFLVRSDEWRRLANGGVHYLQGYLTTDPKRNVRIRIGDEAASLTIKGEADGFTRPEFEYSVPLSDAEDIKKLCLEPILEKTRYAVKCVGLTWEVDEYEGENKGLVVAEVETNSDAPIKHVPAWVGEDISSDERYRNINLVEHPFTRWGGKEKPQTTLSLEHGEALTAGIHRMFAEQLSLAIYELSHTEGSLDTAVHEARKCIKRTRSLLRLIRPAIPKIYSSENRRLQQVGRSLSALRDSQVLLDTLSDLRKPEDTDGHSDSQLQEKFEAVCELLRNRKQSVTQTLQEQGGRQRAIDQLTEARATLHDSSLQKADSKLTIRQLASVIKRGKKAYANAYDDPTADNFHNFRKRAKDLRYQLGVLSNLWPDVFDAYVSSAKDLEQTLGDDHNLAVLTDVVKEHRPHGEEEQALLEHIAKKQAQLREKANCLADRIYSEPVKAWTSRLQASWKAWTACNQD
jgi:adenylate cyclase